MNNRRLTIRISPASLLFSTIGSDNAVVVEHYPLKSSISMAANLREALRQVPMLQEPYQRTVVLTDTPVLMMPLDLFHAEEADTLYRYTFTGQEQQAVASHVLPELNAVAIFSIQKDLRQVVADHFQQVTLMPATASVWRHMHQKSFTGSRAKLYGYFHDRRLEVFSFTQNRFRFYNTFAASTPDDALYFLLSVWKQLGMAPREDELHLAGDLPEKEQFTELVRQYIKRVFISNPSGEFNRAPITQIEGVPYDLMTYYLKR